MLTDVSAFHVCVGAAIKTQTRVAISEYIVLCGIVTGTTDFIYVPTVLVGRESAVPH